MLNSLSSTTHRTQDWDRKTKLHSVGWLQVLARQARPWRGTEWLEQDLA